MDAPKHTVTPWECDGGDIWVDARQQVCCGRGYSECCGEPDVIGGQELVATASPENAAFIVRAVNSHDDLVKALEACPLPSTMGDVQSHYRLFYDWYHAHVKPALSTAKGEA